MQHPNIFQKKTEEEVSESVKLLENMVHKRLLANVNQTLCQVAGAKTYSSSQITCPQCLELMQDKLSREDYTL